MRVVGWVLAIVGVLLLLPGVAWFGYNVYADWVVGNAATTTVIRTESGVMTLGLYSGGHQVVSPDPEAVPELAPEVVKEEAAVAPLPPSGSQDSAARQVPVLTATPVPGPPILPATRLRIPKIAVDAPIVLADNDNLPQFKAIGWYFGTGYPGFRGNVVLFGHVNGQFETLARLGELRVGDELTVNAMEKAYRYVVTETKVVTKDAVEVMAPSRDSRVTLITCTGDFIPLTRDYTHRLIVVGSLAGDTATSQ